VARREHIEKLKADIRSLEEGNRRLEAGSLERAPLGQQVSGRTAVERRYINGLILRGRHILILLDVSASMLHEDLVAILRLPNQIVRITDGLPTQGKTRGLRRYVNSAERMRLFDEALSQLPEHVPIDSVLLPMQGDLQAAHRFWHLSRVTGGALLMPSKDWP